MKDLQAKLDGKDDILKAAQEENQKAKKDAKDAIAAKEEAEKRADGLQAKLNGRADV